MIGGGKAARMYIKAASEIGANKSLQDLMGIESARQNARLFIMGLKGAYPNPPKNFEELYTAINSHEVVVCGGFQPGQSTNAVAALFAETMGADYLFNITNISKVYDKDPDKHSDAKAHDVLSYSEFEEILDQNEQDPGKYALFDHLGFDVVKRSKVKLVFLNGDNPEFVQDILDNKQRGTIVGRKD